MNGPLSKLEAMVHAALTARGHSDNEARTMITKLKNASVFKQAADVELSDDKRWLALSPVIGIVWGKTLDDKGKPKALMVEFRGKSEWIPTGHIYETSDVKEPNDTGVLIISAWIAEKKGFIDSTGKILVQP